MTLTLQPITIDNWTACISLLPTEEQVRASFVAPNTLSLAQAHYEPWWQPCGIYAAIDGVDLMIGFAMYGRWPATGIPAYHDEAKPGVYFILRFMIDARYQGQGYGRAGMQALLAQIKAQPEVQAIDISYDSANSVMAHLCTQAGFRPTGRIRDGEIDARLAQGLHNGGTNAAKVAGMTIRLVQASDAAEWLRLRVALWPDDPEKEAAEIAMFLSTIPHTKLEEMHEAFVCERPDGRLCGLVEVSIRTSAPGCETNHIGYLEAWYVDPDWRKQGVGRALVEQAEAWARAEGCVEMASDTDPAYPLSPAAHAALGYEVVEWSFRKALLG